MGNAGFILASAASVGSGMIAFMYMKVTALLNLNGNPDDDGHEWCMR